LLPKVETATDVLTAAAFPFMLVPMIETPNAVLHAAEIAAAHPGVIGLAFGSFDLAAALGARPGPDGIEMLYSRSAIVIAAASAGIAAIDTPWLDLADAAGAGREAQRARALGFVAKLAIHPTHVAPINAAFTPTEAELAEAREVVAAFEDAGRAGSGVTVVRGRMIDRPLIVAARNVIARAELTQRTRT
jgi:citrate lyase beta subunit